MFNLVVLDMASPVTLGFMAIIAAAVFITPIVIIGTVIIKYVKNRKNKS